MVFRFLMLIIQNFCKFFENFRIIENFENVGRFHNFNSQNYWKAFNLENGISKSFFNQVLLSVIELYFWPSGDG